jgi:multidrug efflux system membrane fusion protein
MRRVVGGVVGAVALAGVLYLWQGGGEHASVSASSARAEPVVRVAAATRRDMPVYARGIGSVDPFNMVAVKTRVDGQIVAVRFEEGQNVRTGDVLYEIDPRPYRAQLAQAEANLARDRALLDNAKLDLDRNVRLKDYASRQSVDTQRAQVAQYEAASASDEAQIEAARLQVEYATIRSPIDGRVGRRLVDPGNVVLAADSKPLVQVSQIEPIAVTFTVPQDTLPAIQARMAAPGDKPAVEARDAQDHAVVARGKLVLVGDAIDRTTGTIALKAVFDNKDRALWPGQFVNARLLLAEMPQVVVVPAGALQPGPDGPILFVVGADSKVAVRPVKVAAKSDGWAAIADGIKPGERVVTDGQDNVGDGLAVEIAADAAG